jgi:7-carboxy-7-deazaguanine synthase
LKVVVFDAEDLAYAERLALAHPRLPLFISAGTDQGLDDEETRARLLARLRWLFEAVARRPALARARVAPQLHVLAWGGARGV